MGALPAVTPGSPLGTQWTLVGKVPLTPVCSQDLWVLAGRGWEQELCLGVTGRFQLDPARHTRPQTDAQVLCSAPLNHLRTLDILVNRQIPLKPSPSVKSNFVGSPI